MYVIYYFAAIIKTEKISISKLSISPPVITACNKKTVNIFAFNAILFYSFKNLIAYLLMCLMLN